jgi:hypothetical protein
MDVASEYGIKIAFHLEPYHGRTVDAIRDDVVYIHRTYGSHASLYRYQCHDNTNNECQRRHGLPMFYVYDSYHIKPSEWSTLLAPSSVSSTSIRRTPMDGVFIGLWLESNDGPTLVNSHFDGAYTYFASRGFTSGSTPSSWPAMKSFLHQNNMLFIASIGTTLPIIPLFVYCYDWCWCRCGL